MLHPTMLAQDRLRRRKKGKVGNPLAVGAKQMVVPGSLQV